MLIPTQIQEDVNFVLVNYELSDNGITQFYVGSTREVFDGIMEDIRQRANIPPEKIVTHTLTRTNEGGLDGLVEREPLQRDEGGYLVKAYGFAETNMVGHALNQFTHIRHLNRRPSIIGIHIDTRHSNYASAVKTAKDSQFKVRVIEL